MVQKVIVRKNEYQDSVRLMSISRKASSLHGVKKVLVLLGTDGNKKIITDLGFMCEEIKSATPNDLIISVESENESGTDTAFTEIDCLLSKPANSETKCVDVHSIEEAVALEPQANLALFSVPGQFATLDAVKAIELDLNVMLFSDNVPLKDEVYLKELAIKKELLMMGPDCGTAIINGIPLGFANVVNRGEIGVIGASGTGIQEITSLIDALGKGISHAIGVGGRDLKESVGGRMMISAIKMLAKDKETKSLVLLSKPASHKVMEKVVSEAVKTDLPVTICFLGREAISRKSEKVNIVNTLEDAAYSVCRKSKEPVKIPESFNGYLQGMKKERKYLRGLYAGGTLCYEALLIFSSDNNEDVYSNIALESRLRLTYPAKGSRHLCIDMGEDEFTEGRPHPMINSEFRQERFVEEFIDPETRVVLIDIVLGYGSATDPAGDMVKALQTAREKINDSGPLLIAHVCGTDGDPQSLKNQKEQLEQAGFFLFDTNADAARVAMRIINNDLG